jgi:dipeptidyl peptidase-like protein
MLRRAPSDGADVIIEVKAGDHFAMLDDSLGWAWGYAGDERRVGYLRSDALRPQ